MAARGTNLSRATAFIAARMRWSVTLAARTWASTMLKRADSDIGKPLQIWPRLIGRHGPVDNLASCRFRILSVIAASRLPGFFRQFSLRPRGGVVTQRTANPRTPVRFRAWPPILVLLCWRQINHQGIIMNRFIPAACAVAVFAMAAPATFAADILVHDAKSQPESLAHAPDGTLIVGSASSPYVYRIKPGSTATETFIDASADGPGTFFFGQ